MSYLKSLTLSIAVSTIILTPAYAGTAKGKPFVALEGQIVEVEGAVSSLQDQIDLLIGRVETLEEHIAAAEGAIAELDSQNQLLQTLIDNALTSIEDINALIEELQADTTSNSDLITTLQAAVADIEQGQIDLGTNLQGQIDNNTLLINALQAQLDSQADWEAFQQNLTSGICPDGSAVTDILPDGSYVCDAGSAASGELKSFTVFGNTIHVPPSSFVLGFATCPAGSAVSSSQWVSGGIYSQYMRFTQTYVQGSADAWRPANSGRLVAFNASGTYTVSFRPAATCLKIAP